MGCGVGVAEWVACADGLVSLSSSSVGLAPSSLWFRLLLICGLEWAGALLEHLCVCACLRAPLRAQAWGCGPSPRPRWPTLASGAGNDARQLTTGGRPARHAFAAQQLRVGMHHARAHCARRAPTRHRDKRGGGVRAACAEQSVAPSCQALGTATAVQELTGQQLAAIVNEDCTKLKAPSGQGPPPLHRCAFVCFMSACFCPAPVEWDVKPVCAPAGHRDTRPKIGAA